MENGRVAAPAVRSADRIRSASVVTRASVQIAGQGAATHNLVARPATGREIEKTLLLQP